MEPIGTRYNTAPKASTWPGAAETRTPPAGVVGAGPARPGAETLFHQPTRVGAWARAPCGKSATMVSAAPTASVDATSRRCGVRGEVTAALRPGEPDVRLPHARREGSSRS